MTVKEYLEKYRKDNVSVTFIVAKAEKDEMSPFYHPVYMTTPIFNVWEWMKNDKMMDYIVLNDNQAPIDWLSGANWNNRYNHGDLTCMLVISKEELHTLYSKEQAASIEKFIEKEIVKKQSKLVGKH